MVTKGRLVPFYTTVTNMVQVSKNRQLVEQ